MKHCSLASFFAALLALWLCVPAHAQCMRGSRQMSTRASSAGFQTQMSTMQPGLLQTQQLVMRAQLNAALQQQALLQAQLTALQQQAVLRAQLAALQQNAANQTRGFQQAAAPAQNARPPAKPKPRQQNANQAQNAQVPQ
jgi:hypothetical protein